MFFYVELEQGGVNSLPEVSVPRRGFVVFLLLWNMSPHVGAQTVSVPRRGFVVFLRDPVAEFAINPKFLKFQSPEGDSLFFYKGKRRIPQPAYATRFSPPKGIRCFSTKKKRDIEKEGEIRFSPPKGIRCFSTYR